MPERPLQPPKSFRLAIPLTVKRIVLGLQMDICACGCGVMFKLLDPIEFDHRPPLADRGWDPVAIDTIPPANDPAHIFALFGAHHLKRTVADAGERAATKRQQTKAIAHETAMAEKEPGVPRKRSGKIKSRGFERKPR